VAHSITVRRMISIAGAAVTLVTVHSTVLEAQADSGRLATQELRSSIDKKKKQEQPAPPIPRGQSVSDYGRIGSNPNKGRDVAPRCEDAYAMAAQIMSGGPTDRMVSSRNLGNMDASQGLVAPPFQARMEPREPGFTSSARHGRSEINKSLNGTRRPINPAGRTQGC
jgi:hypothetical protein